MFDHPFFYHGSLRRYVSIFGTLFNNIKVERRDNSGNLVDDFIVPISYGPHQKFLARLNQQTDDLKQTPALTLPRISFEILDVTYDGTRRLGSMEAYKSAPSVAKWLRQNSPAPYNINFTMTIYVKYAEDGAKIIEQILPWFKPEWTTHVRLIDDVDLVMDIPTVLNSVATEEVYEADFTERTVIQWTLDFTMKAYFFGPIEDASGKVIKFIDVRYHDNLDIQTSIASEHVHTQPGMTSKRQPTNKISESVPYQLIEFEDPWDWADEIISIDDVLNGYTE